MNGYFMTDKGKVRDHNEDNGAILENSKQQILAVVADGMGGHKAGDIASAMVITSLREEWAKSGFLASPEEAEEWLTTSITQINNSIYNHAQEHEECNGMGTTVVAIVCGPEFITIGHIGDSRAYLLNEKGFSQITEDHSLVNELVRTGQISKDDAEYHPRKNVLLRALGTEKDVTPDVQTIGWDKSNKLLLCSDGLSNKLTESELHNYVQDTQDLQENAEELINEANNRGGEDNISLALVYYDDSEKEGES
ncbi:Stp1/IreP family PP2C-type Ser/Thr phosphatase [Aquibacillus halophilus]|uniref:protein-serine/threonine phosphatase n=1 Tax=Aquibacillus halophilus TaxID=930132 RepID=A0A6A8DEL4_9BACI|nr:Stp1/IreP family PP2C-type Ser/Thr phosphatase [Aquibacillus halophilus]MRH42211.1 Stp1/IreP family PP2C-type Ser/Thr phosphatase [Aquibacillus halophilus]